MCDDDTSTDLGDEKKTFGAAANKRQHGSLSISQYPNIKWDDMSTFISFSTSENSMTSRNIKLNEVNKMKKNNDIKIFIAVFE